MVENCDFLKRLRNVHLEKSVATGICRVRRSPKTAKVPLKVHLRLRFQNPGKPRTAGLCGRLRALATAALYLVLKSNGLPRPKIRLKKFGFSSKSVPANIAKKLPLQLRPKPLFIAFFNFSHKRPTFAFTGESGYTLGFRRRIAHKGTHGETGGVLGGGGITTLGLFHTFRKPCVARGQNGKLCRFWVLAGCAPEERRKPSGQRCAYARRCPVGVAAPLGCVIFFRFCRNCGLYALFQILLSVLQTLQLVPFLCKLRLSSFLFGSEFNGFRSKQAGFFAIILENV